MRYAMTNYSYSPLHWVYLVIISSLYAIFHNWLNFRKLSCFSLRVLTTIAQCLKRRNKRFKRSWSDDHQFRNFYFLFFSFSHVCPILSFFFTLRIALPSPVIIKQTNVLSSIVERTESKCLENVFLIPVQHTKMFHNFSLHYVNCLFWAVFVRTNDCLWVCVCERGIF